MEDAELERRLTKVEERAKSNTHRLKDLEIKEERNHQLLVTIKELAVNMEHIAKEQEKQGIRLAKLEGEPVGRLTQIKTAIITALTAALISGVMNAFIFML